MSLWDAAHNRFGTPSISSSALGAIGSYFTPPKEQWIVDMEKAYQESLNAPVAGPPAPSDVLQRNELSTNGSDSIPSVNVSSSNLNDTKETFDNMTSDQQVNNFSWFKDYFDRIIEENNRINDLSKQNTDEARRYSEYVYKNQAKWYVDGLKKAGINPLMIAHGLSPTPFTSMGSAQVFSPDTPSTEYANTVNTQINSLVSLLQHAERLDFDKRVAFIQQMLNVSEIEAKKYASNIGAMTSLFSTMVGGATRLGSSSLGAFF